MDLYLVAKLRRYFVFSPDPNFVAFSYVCFILFCSLQVNIRNESIISQSFNFLELRYKGEIWKRVKLGNNIQSRISLTLMFAVLLCVPVERQGFVYLAWPSVKMVRAESVRCEVSHVCPNSDYFSWFYVTYGANMCSEFGWMSVSSTTTPPSFNIIH